MAMIKAKFGAAVKSKSPTAQVNEVLCKVLAHNICVLIQSFYELGIESTFAPASEPEPKVIDLNQYRARLGFKVQSPSTGSGQAPPQGLRRISPVTSDAILVSPASYTAFETVFGVLSGPT